MSSIPHRGRMESTRTDSFSGVHLGEDNFPSVDPDSSHYSNLVCNYALYSARWLRFLESLIVGVYPKTLQIFQVEPKEVAWGEGRDGGFLPGEAAAERGLLASLAWCFPASYPPAFAFAARPRCLSFPAG